jgi:hypothetical protein
MAQTYTIAAVGVGFALNKCMLGVFNGAGSGRIVRIYRVWTLNNGTAAVTGVMTNFEMRRTSAGAGGSAITSEAFPAQIIVSTNQTVTTTDLFRRTTWSNDEATGNAACSMDELETLPPLNCIWDVGYGDTNVEPIVLREGYGLAVINTGNTAVGTVDVFFEVTLAAS